MEKIITIETLDEQRINDVSVGEYDIYNGYKITTTENIYYFVISADTCCSEVTGYLTTNDSVDEFFGAEIKDIEWNDVNLGNSKIYSDSSLSGDLISCVFININTTDNRKLQLVAYNDHYGFNGHDILLIKKQSCS